jgi:hypothetical protein
MQSWVGKAGILIICTAIVAGCGGGSKPNNTVSQVTVSPTALSLNPGDVGQLSTSTLNSASAAVTATITFTSSNPNLVTVSTGGLVCAGVWDANFVVCNVAKDNLGNPLTGTANITATANGVNSTPVPVAVHQQLSSIIVSPVAGCTSVNQTQQFQATACSSVATPHDSSGPCAPNAKDITSLVGPFTWTQTTTLVGTVDTNGLVTAAAPGQMGIIASIGEFRSAATPFRTCMPVVIELHLSTDPAGSPTTSASLTPTQTLTLEADMVDEKGVTVPNAPVSIVSNKGAAASVSSTTLTANSPGGAGILAACVPPGCGANLNLAIYSNLFSTTVNGTSPTTTVYVSTTFAPPSGSFSTLVPLDTSTNTLGTAINLPGPPNSLVFTANGLKAYMGTTAGLASIDTASNTATLVAPNVTGKVLAVSPDGNMVVLSNAASAPDPVTGVIGPIEPNPAKQTLVVFTANSSSVQSFVVPGAAAAAFSGDSFKAFIVTNNGSGNVYVFSPFISLQTVNVAGNSSDISTLASGPFAFLANSAGLEVMATCNDVQQPTASNPPTHSTTIQLVQPFANSNVFVAVDSSGIDVETATITPLVPPLVISPASCPPNVSYTNQFIDFGLGNFTARQLLVASNAVGNNGSATNGTHIVVLPVGSNKLLTAVAGGSPSVAVITLAAAGATEALSGGLTLDGNTAWVGVAGSNTVDQIDLVGGSDTNQIVTSFMKRDSTPAPPNLVAVKPK